MGKRKWNGNINESQYIETGNVVNDVIENNGRILHEPTVDGYTHEMVDRGDYITDDYYFPQRKSGGKPHIHYEVRSNGEVLIDGKKITSDIEREMKNMTYEKKILKERSMDSNALKERASDQIKEGRKLYELGKKFELDKTKLEDEIDRVQNSKLSDNDKGKLVMQLEEAITALQEKYERDVIEEEHEVREQLKDQIEAMQEASDEFNRQADSFKKTQRDIVSADISEAVNVAETKGQEFQNMKKIFVDELKIQIEQSEIQRQKIFAKR